MRKEPNVRLDQLRMDGPAGANAGTFRLGRLAFIVGDGGGWDHVSVSHPTRLPTWDEMDRIKQLVFRDDEVVMQLHINDARKVNQCQNCLHLWRPQTPEEMAVVRAKWEAGGEAWPYEGWTAPGSIPLPPVEFV